MGIGYRKGHYVENKSDSSVCYPKSETTIHEGRLFWYGDSVIQGEF